MSRFNRGRGRGRGAFGGFSTAGDQSTEKVNPAILKNARRTGILNLSQRGLDEIPDNVWTLMDDVPQEAKTISLDNTDDKWWDVTEMTKLLLASNQLKSIGEGIRNFPALTVLDVSISLVQSRS